MHYIKHGILWLAFLWAEIQHGCMFKLQIFKLKTFSLLKIQ